MMVEVLGSNYSTPLAFYVLQVKLQVRFRSFEDPRSSRGVGVSALGC